MTRIPVYILAGGQSRRFGTDKARATLAGKPLIQHVAEGLRAFSSELFVVAAVADKYADLGLATIEDIDPGLGPLGGLYTALQHCSQDWLLLAPCDFPEIRDSWLISLINAPRQGADAIAFRSNRWQPLPALYNKRGIGKVAGMIASGDYAMQSLLSTLPARDMALPDDWPSKSGVNTPADLARLTYEA